MAIDGLFELHNYTDLLRKLEREYDRWKAEPLSSDFAWNFFVTAEHLPDWIYHQEMSTSGKVRPDLLGLQHGEPRDFRLSHTLTRLCSNLANGGKHFYIKDSKIKKVVQRAVREMTGYVEDGYVEDGYVEDGYVEEGYFAEEPALRVYLTPVEVVALQKDGLAITAEDIDALWLAARILEFWQRFPVFQTPTGADTPCPPLTSRSLSFSGSKAPASRTWRSAWAYP